MLKILLGHGRQDVSYDRDHSTDDRVEWTNVGPDPVKVQLILPEVSDPIPFVLQPQESYQGWTGSILRVAE